MRRESNIKSALTFKKYNFFWLGSLHFPTQIQRRLHALSWHGESFVLILKWAMSIFLQVSNRVLRSNPFQGWRVLNGSSKTLTLAFEHSKELLRSQVWLILVILILIFLQATHRIHLFYFVAYYNGRANTSLILVNPCLFAKKTCKDDGYDNNTLKVSWKTFWTHSKRDLLQTVIKCTTS